MAKFNVDFNNGEFVDVVEANSAGEAKTNFIKTLLSEGKVNGSVFLLRNKVKVNKINDDMDGEENDMDMNKDIKSVVDQDEVTENFVAPLATPIAPVVIKRGRGRPINPNSANQLRIKAREAKIAAGIPIRRGRPINPNSMRQIKIQEKAQRNANKVLTGLESIGVSVF